LNNLIDRQRNNSAKEEHIKKLKKYEEISRNIREFLYALKDTIYILRMLNCLSGFPLILGHFNYSF